MACYLFTQLKRLQTEKSGNVGILFAFVVTVLAAAVGAMIDFQRSSIERVKMQAALDAATLAAASAVSASSYERSRIVEKVFLANFDNASGAEVSSSISVDGGTISATVEAFVPTTFAKVFGVDCRGGR